MIAKLLNQFYIPSVLLVLSSIDAFNVLNLPVARVPYDKTVSRQDYNVSNWSTPSLIQDEKQEEQDGSQGENGVEMSNPNADIHMNKTISAILSLQPITACYGVLGCITRFNFPDPLLWPINLLPESREKINTHFTLYTRENPNPQPLVHLSADKLKWIASTTFKASRRTKIVIHGWRNTGHEKIFFILVQRLLINGDYNVIKVHWAGGSQAIYFQSHANIRLVGLEIALLVNTMVDELGVNPADVHLIGHSLGAHTAGYAGEKIPNLGQITGLDPAGPFFNGLPSFARLDHTDAAFVDTVMTNAGTLGIGIHEPSGHLNFYPNGGKYQPGCRPSNLQDILNDPTAILSEATSCDHMRAVHFYSESFTSTDCKTIAYECHSYAAFNNGLCTWCGSDNTKCAPFGLEATSFPTRSRKNVNLYFNTGADFPYCRYQYLVKVSLAKPSFAKTKVSGILKLSVIGHTGVLPRVSRPISIFEHGKDYPFLAVLTTNLGTVSKVDLRWIPILLNLFDPTCFFGFCDQRMYVASATVSLLNSYPESNRIANTYYNCPIFGFDTIGTLFNSDLSGKTNCSSTFLSLDTIWIPGNWILLKK